MSIQRYNIVYDEAPNSYYPKLVIVESDEGRWVRQEDARALELALASERTRRGALEAMLKRVVKDFTLIIEPRKSPLCEEAKALLSGDA